MFWCPPLFLLLYFSAPIEPPGAVCGCVWLCVELYIDIRQHTLKQIESQGNAFPEAHQV